MKHVDKPWGYEQILTNEYYTIKFLFMKAGHRCSLQLHQKKIETIMLLEGELKLYISPNKDVPLEVKLLKPKELHEISPGTIHRVEAVTDSLYLEVSTNELEDVIRLSDDFGRV